MGLIRGWELICQIARNHLVDGDLLEGGLVERGGAQWSVNGTYTYVPVYIMNACVIHVLSFEYIHTYIHTYIHFLFYNAGLMFGNLLLVDVDLQLKSSKQKENLIQNLI